MDILVVDDDRVDREVLIRGIRKHDLSSNIVEVVTAEDALVVFKQHHFDVVFVDHQLASECGIEVLRSMREYPQRKSSAIIMMSGTEVEAVAIKAIRSGAQDFILKSEINASGLRRCITHSKARVELEDEIFELKKRPMLAAMH